MCRERVVIVIFILQVMCATLGKFPLDLIFKN